MGANKYTTIEDALWARKTEVANAILEITQALANKYYELIISEALRVFEAQIVPEQIRFIVTVEAPDKMEIRYVTQTSETSSFIESGIEIPKEICKSEFYRHEFEKNLTIAFDQNSNSTYTDAHHQFRRFDNQWIMVIAPREILGL